MGDTRRLVAAPVYLLAMRICTTVVEHGGTGYLNILVLLFAWNAIKFACTAVIAPIWMLRPLARRARAEQSRREFPLG